MKRTATAALMLCTAFGLSLSAQSGSGQLYDYDFMLRNSEWLTSTNAAGLGTNSSDRISVAELSFEKDNGGLIDNEGSPDSYAYGIYAEAYSKISEKIAFSGQLGYSGFHGKDMGGSVFVNPDYNPVNFYESTGEYRGMVNRESYYAKGGISYSLTPAWSIGAKIDFTAGNSAKRKDPRYRSTLMDMDLSAGARYAMPGFELGFNLLYRRTTETVLGKLYADTSIKYYMLVDYGGYWGRYDLFDGNYGYVSLESERPMFNNFYGGALQLVFGGDNLRFFNELSYLYRSGYYGSKSETSVQFSRHTGHCISYSGNLNIKGGSRNRHIITLDADFEALKNFENSYRFDTKPGENTTVQYLGENQRLKRLMCNVALRYTGYSGIENNLPRWEYGAEADFNMKDSYATIYPDSRKQFVSSFGVQGFGKGNFLYRERNVFTACAELDFCMGAGTKNTDLREASSTSPQPKSSDSYLGVDYEYRTLPCVGGALSFKYTRAFGNKGFRAYILLRDRFVHSAGKVEYLQGKYRNFAEIRIGCNF